MIKKWLNSEVPIVVTKSTTKSAQLALEKKNVKCIEIPVLIIINV